MKKTGTVVFLFSLLLALSILPSAIGENTPATAVAEKPTLSPSLADMPAGLIPSVLVLPQALVSREGLTGGETPFPGYTRIQAEAGSSATNQPLGQRPQIESFKPDQVIIKLKEKETLETLVRQPYSQRSEKHQSLLSGLKSRHGLKNEKPVFSSLHQELKSRNLTQEKLSREIQARRLKGRKALAPAKESVDLLPVYVLETERKDISGLCEELKKDLDIEYAQPNYVYNAVMTPNDPDYSNLWGLQANKLNCAPAWDLSQGEGVVVAVVDTGIDYNHEDLWDNIWVNPEVISDVNSDGRIDLDDCDTDQDHEIESNEIVDHMFGWDYGSGDNNPMDTYGHGTHCAGTIAGVGNNSIGVIGVAPQARLMAVKGFPDNSGSTGTDYLVDCLRYAADKGADVLSNSWGGGSASDPTLESAVDYAYGLGCVVVFAAGNSNIDINGRSPLNHHYFYNPFNPLTVMAIAATDSDDNRANFYNWASNYGEQISVAAPGVGVLSTLPGDAYGSYSGTSMACPHVAGLAALVIARYPILGNEGVRTMIESYADDLGDTGKDIYFGWGRINAYESVSNDPPALSCSVSAFPGNGQKPFSATFNLSANRRPEEIVSWSFIYGDGGSTGGSAPLPVTVSHTYQYDGTYTATLTITDREDDTAADTETIVVRDPINLLVPSQYSTIQAAIDAAGSGDIVLVADGTYVGSGNRLLTWNGLFKHITVKSENGPEHCIINCEQEENTIGFWFFGTGQDRSDLIDGFTITGARDNVGGGIMCYSVSPTIKNCIIAGNGAVYNGGGIYCSDGSSPLIQNCIIVGNSGYIGGGIFCYGFSFPQIENCVLTGNDSSSGGGIFCDQYSSPIAENCIIAGNRSIGHFEHTFSGISVGGGGGIFCCWNSYFSIQNCVIAGNSAGSGGGILVAFADATIRNCVIAGNSASQDGAGIGCYVLGSIPIENCTIAGNGGSGASGIYCWYDEYDFDLSPQVVNSILWNNGSEIDSERAISVNYSDVQGGYTGFGNINADPLFTGGPAGDWEGVSYDSATFQTTFTDNDAAFTPGELVGKLLNPNTSQNLQHPIVANTATTITVWSDLSSVEVDSEYQVYDYQLDVFSPFSPCIDAADGSVAPETDIEGSSRYDFPAMPDGRAAGTPPVDIGAYEAQTQPEPLFCLLSTDRLYGSPPIMITFTIRAGDFESGIDYWELDYGDGTSVSGSETPPSTLTHTYSEVGTYEATLTITNVAEETVSDSRTIVIREALLVPSQYSTIQDAIDDAVDMDTVLVADGTYTGTGNKNLTWDGSLKHITVKSENGPENCIIDCEGSDRGFVLGSAYLNDQDIIEGFTITGGYTYPGGGIYCGNYSSPLIQNCTITGNSVSQWGNTPDSGAGIYCGDYSSPIIRNCIITENISYHSGGGGGICCGGNSSATIEYCTIAGNTASHGGGIFCDSASPTIRNCTITGNAASAAGGGIYCGNYSSPLIQNCTIADNTTTGWWVSDGGGIYCSGNSCPFIENCLIAGNIALGGGNGGIFCDFSSPFIANCTVTGNFDSYYGGNGIYCYSNSSPTVVNSILWDNNVEIELDSSTVSVAYSDVEGGYSGAGNIDSDPLFVDAETGDYHLSSGSPCIDCADGSLAPLTDKDGNSRCDFPAVSDGPEAGTPPADIGAYEARPSCSLSVTPAVGQPPLLVTFTLSAGDFAGAVDSWELDYGDEDNDSGSGTPPLTLNHSYPDLGTYTATLTVTGTNEETDSDSRTITVKEALLVPSQYATIKGAIDAAVEGDTILVADGTYTGSLNLNLTWDGSEKHLTLKSENGPENCIIDCEENGRGFEFISSSQNSQDVIDGFTITNSSAGGIFCQAASPTIRNCVITGNSSEDYGGGIYCEASSSLIQNCAITGNTAACSGGGILCYDNPSLTITDCTITGNTATYDSGGGIASYYNSGVLIANCIISGNTAEYAGGIYCEASSPHVQNCVISGNSAEDHAGGIDCYDNSSPVITNCTITGNTVSVSAGGAISCYYSSSPVVTNSIVWDNSSGIYLDSGSAITVTYSDVEDGYTGTGNIDADPQFVDASGDDYRLGWNSPCIDVGIAAGAPAIDIEGTARWDCPGRPATGQVSVVDMGCYEVEAAPPLLWSTFLGGSSEDFGSGLALDSAGCVYVTGETHSSDFPTRSGYDATFAGSSDAFVTKFQADGTDIVYSTFLGGGQGYGYDRGDDIVVNNVGEACVAGKTFCSDFPTTSGAYDTTLNGGSDIFVTKLNASGTGLEFSTLLGGSDYDVASGLALDSAGSVYVAGSTNSSNFPATSGSRQNDWDVVVCKFNDDGSDLIYGMYLGEDSSYGGAGSLAVDSTGCAYVTGETAGGFPSTSGAFDESYNGNNDAFVTKLNSAGDSLVYSTFLGGSNSDSGRGISLDSSGCVYVTGKTKTRDLATSGAYQETPGYKWDAFVAKLNADGSTLGFFTYLGGNNNDWGTGITVDSSGDILLAGGTCSSDFPVTEGTFACMSAGGYDDVFVARVNSDGSILEYSTYLGGSGYGDAAGGKVEVDSFGCAYVTGCTGSEDFPTTSGAYDETKNGGYDVFVTKLSMVASPAIYSVNVSVSPSNGGSVSKDPDRLYGLGAKVELTASPASGYAFNYWGGDASGSQNPKTIEVTGNMNVTAYFVQGGYTLTTSVSPYGSGWINRDPDKAVYSANEVVTLTASPDYGYGFDYWSGDVGGNQNPKTITMTGNASVTANFYWGGPCW